jgi:hypothetical protein
MPEASLGSTVFRAHSLDRAAAASPPHIRSRPHPQPLLHKALRKETVRPRLDGDVLYAPFGNAQPDEEPVKT